jgi:hypothetical protein
MSCSLTIGNLKIYDCNSAIISKLRLFGLSDEEIFRCPWSTCPENIAYIEPLNLSAQALFLEHVAQLEGLKNITEATKQSKYRHLQYWLTTVWVPVKFDNACLLKQSPDDPLYLASTYGLLANLEEIKLISPEGLGEPPACYSDSESEPEETNDILRWVWYAHFEAGNLSLKYGAPLST